jgi:hypothetical protein
VNNFTGEDDDDGLISRGLRRPDHSKAEDSPTRLLISQKPSPRLTRLMFKSNYCRSLERFDDTTTTDTDELSADVDRILEEIAGLDNIMESKQGDKREGEGNKDEVSFVSSEIREFCSSESESQVSNASLSKIPSSAPVERIVRRKPPLPPSCRNAGMLIRLIFT